jgi:hypothetical protein
MTVVFHYENQCFEISEGQFMVPSGKRMKYNMSGIIQNSTVLNLLKTKFCTQYFKQQH